MRNRSKVMPSVAALVTGIGLTAGTGALDVDPARPCGQEVPCDPIVLEGPIPTPFPTDDPSGLPSEPPGRPVSELKRPSYVQEEFFVSGTVDVYNFDTHPAVRGQAPGDRLVVATADVPFKTRMVVRRPARKRRFSGDVVVEMMNSTAGFDNTPAWHASAEYLAREGGVYIGLTTSGNQSIPLLVGGCGGLLPACGRRYATLTMSDNGQEYEIVSALVTALRSGDPAQRPLPVDWKRIEHVYLTGQSQQGGSVITYASEFHFSGGVDGYFFQGAAAARRIRGVATEDCGATGAPAYPDCVARLQGEEVRVRTDVPVPVYRGSSEGDVGDGSTRQNDTDTSPHASFRLIEVPGTSHNPIHALELPFGGLILADLCRFEPFSLADGPIFGSHVWFAMWENLRRQVEKGILPPYAPRIDIVDGVIQRDEHRNALGGVRLPELDVPTNSYFSPNNEGKPACTEPGAPPPPDCVDAFLATIGDLACRSNGSLEPLPAEMLAALYPSHRAYVKANERRTRALVAARFLLREDAKQHRKAARRADVGR